MVDTRGLLHAMAPVTCGYCNRPEATHVMRVWFYDPNKQMRPFTAFKTCKIIPIPQRGGFFLILPICNYCNTLGWGPNYHHILGPEALPLITWEHSED